MFDIFKSNVIIEIEDAIGNVGRFFKRRKTIPK